MKLYTIGYGNREPKEFIPIMMAKQIRTAVDVRLRPHRAQPSKWTKAKVPDKGLEKRLRGFGIGHRSLVESGRIGEFVWEGIRGLARSLRAAA